MESWTREQLVDHINSLESQVKTLKNRVNSENRSQWQAYQRYRRRVRGDKNDIIPCIFKAIERGLSVDSLAYQFCLTQFKFWSCDNYRGNAIQYSPTEQSFWYGMFNAFGKKVMLYLKGYANDQTGFRKPSTEEEKDLPSHSPRLFNGNFVIPALAMFQRMNATRMHEEGFTDMRLKQVEEQFEYTKNRYESLKRHFDQTAAAAADGQPAKSSKKRRTASVTTTNAAANTENSTSIHLSHNTSIQHHHHSNDIATIGPLNLEEEEVPEVLLEL